MAKSLSSQSSQPSNSTSTSSSSKDRKKKSKKAQNTGKRKHTNVSENEASDLENQPPATKRSKKDDVKAANTPQEKDIAF
ncbi:hypothetical protein VKT23_011645 [Stygiomarasmius scandens]|uniref:Uncharacterized protein n=1 Tax=Marasmiellus scandens TaxID=2682957 RepID=A0ABR1JA87_9AGAR